MEEKIKVLLVQTGMEPQVVELENTLEALKQAVGGYIETWQPFEENVILVCNEDGKLAGLPLNRPVHNQIGQMVDAIAGDFFVCGQGGEDFTSLTVAQLEKYGSMFKVPQKFTFLDGKLIAMPIDPIRPTPKPERMEQQKTYRLYQVKNGEEYRDLRFSGTDHLKVSGHTIDPKNYDLVYTGAFEDGMTLGGLFEKFNIAHPADYRGRSMSVSDVVVLARGGEEAAFFCDRDSYKKLDSFVTSETPSAPKPTKKRSRPKKKGGDAR